MRVLRIQSIQWVSPRQVLLPLTRWLIVCSTIPRAEATGVVLDVEGATDLTSEVEVAELARRVHEQQVVLDAFAVWDAGTEG